MSYCSCDDFCCLTGCPNCPSWGSNDFWCLTGREPSQLNLTLTKREKVLIFGDTQTNRQTLHRNIYIHIIIVPPPFFSRPLFSGWFCNACQAHTGGRKTLLQWQLTTDNLAKEKEERETETPQGSACLFFCWKWNIFLGIKAEQQSSMPTLRFFSPEYRISKLTHCAF